MESNGTYTGDEDEQMLAADAQGEADAASRCSEIDSAYASMMDHVHLNDFDTHRLESVPVEPRSYVCVYVSVSVCLCLHVCVCILARFAFERRSRGSSSALYS